MNPETGEGFDAVLVRQEEYFDPQATDPEKFPGAVGLTIRKNVYWQGDVEFDTFETVGPKFGPKWPEGTMKVSGLGTDAEVWGLSDEPGPDGSYDPWIQNGLGNRRDANGNLIYPSTGTPLFTVPLRTPPGVDIVGKHPWTPCYEDDGSPTLAEPEHGYIDITLLGAYGGDVKFPVMPEDITADFTHEYWTPRVVGLGEIIMPGGQSMETVSWSSFFPASYDDFCVITPLELEDPKSLTARLIWTMRFKMNCMLIIGGGIWNDQVVITSFNYSHRAGEPFDIYYSITMKRYRAPIVSTSPNPDALWDRWYKDPRAPGGQVGASTDPATEEGSEVTGEPNPEQVPVEADPPPPPVTFDEGPSTSPGRESLISIETDTIQPWVVGGLPMYPPNTPPYDPNQIAPPPQPYGETFQDTVARMAKRGPNDMNSMLALNQWVLDNNYNVYTSHLPVGAGVRYYKETPVAVSKPLVLVSPNIGPPQTRPDGTIYYPRGDVGTVQYPGNTPLERR